ncbi:MAG: hypothetical protein AAF517_21250 [Planctomycetota bacterium]
MQYIVRVRDAKGSEKRAKVTAKSEEALRAGLAKKGLTLIDCRPVEENGTSAESSEPKTYREPKTYNTSSGAARTTDVTPKGERGCWVPEPADDWSSERIVETIEQLEEILESHDHNVHFVPLSTFLSTMIFPVQHLFPPAIASLAQNALRHIVDGRKPDEVLGFLTETCQLDESMARMIPGMAIDAGYLCLSVSDGGYTQEEAIAHLLKTAPGAEEALVRPLIDRCTKYTDSLVHRRAADQAIKEFHEVWG